MRVRNAVLVPLLALPVIARPADTIPQLARDFFAWRHATQPVTSDDVARPERALDWVPDVSPNSLRKQREKLGEFQRRFTSAQRAPGVAGEVDVLLLRSAIERVDFELNVLGAPSRNPDFYVY